MSENPATEMPVTILCVDDEPNILASLRRLFRIHGYSVLTAPGGQEGLALLETEAVDLVISDMRMPTMDGAAFLEHVRSRWPDTMRLLLTGYADVQSIVEAINRGEIYRYITKPWDDHDIVLVVRHALERKALETEKRRLEALTHRQNEELKLLNASLEAKVQERTAELQTVNEKLKNNFLTSIKVFSNVIEMRGGKLVGHSRRVADLARRIALRMGMSAREGQEIFVAGLLADIGKIGFSDDLLDIPVNMMNGDQLGQFHKHTIRAEQLLMPLEDLQGTARILRSQHERYDGAGFPDGLSGDDIPLGSRILAVASDYDNLQQGVLVQRRVAAEDAQKLIVRGAGNRYDEAVVAAFKYVVMGVGEEELIDEVEVTAQGLLAGMILSRDLLSRDSALLLPAEHVLSERMIEKLMLYDATHGGQLIVRIRRRK
ncbi:HD domain-containing phosphohydrolase [Undibacterium sp.]|jgi:response regulator RpfG family c-di-GMP phosphodiesterase|uniref:HD domain-containing phosphohydrolase n=1 Tax=Undibacterium sp. TaxID=1914977 RepID=UPI002B57017F|nr:HD domain-containing phosphohydrolase [Undibacterium sp.]HTD06265.1 HD domain-containing phosphohydrolase [Undibacterium sp.]